MLRQLVALTFGIACVLGLPQTTIDDYADWRVVGGQEAKDGQFPYQVSLKRGNSHFCGGSIISKRWILTAAHCVSGSKPSSVTVVVGTNTLNAGGTKYAASKIVSHKNWDSKKIVNDIALVQVDEDIAIGGKVATVPIGKDNVGGGVQVVLSGWGRTSYPGSIPNKLQFINLKTLTFADCKAQHAQGPQVFETQLCTFTKRGEGACHGDSGGPLVANGKQAGVVSWGIPCAKGKPDVFTRVSSFASWIESNAK